MTTACEGRASFLPPACPLDYCAISPHALAESLQDHQGLYLTHGCSDSIPLSPHHFASPRVHTANKLFHCGRVYVCMHTTHPFFSFRSPLFFWDLIRITITGMWLRAVLSQWQSGERESCPTCFWKGTRRSIHPDVLSEAKVPLFSARLRPTVFVQMQLGFLDHTVYFRTSPMRS